MSVLTRDVMAIGRIASVEKNGAKSELHVRLNDDDGPLFLVSREFARVLKIGRSVCIEGHLRANAVVFASSVTPIGPD